MNSACPVGYMLVKYHDVKHILGFWHIGVFPNHNNNNNNNLLLILELVKE